MTASPRPLTLLAPRRWAVSLLAWLMLVLNAAHALPPAAGNHHATASHAAHQDVPPKTMAHAAVADDCCSAGHDGPPAPAPSSCHCPTMCAPALLPVPGLTVAARLPLEMVAPAAVPTAPRRPAAPPLRPPQA